MCGRMDHSDLSIDKKCGGGVLIAVHSEFATFFCKDCWKGRTVRVRCDGLCMSLVRCICIPPESTAKVYQDFPDVLSRIVESYFNFLNLLWQQIEIFNCM